MSANNSPRVFRQNRGEFERHHVSVSKHIRLPVHSDMPSRSLQIKQGQQRLQTVSVFEPLRRHNSDDIQLKHSDIDVS